MNEPRLRRAARAVVLDPEDRVLLVRFEFQDYVVWATPGGGIAEAESDEDALRRELHEEAGLERIALGPVLWNRTHLRPFDSGRWDGQTETVYFVRTEAFEPKPALRWTELNAEGMTAIRWWSLDELAASDAVFAPRRLPDLLRELVLRGPPERPLDVGI